MKIGDKKRSYLKSVEMILSEFKYSTSTNGNVSVRHSCDKAGARLTISKYHQKYFGKIVLVELNAVKPSRKMYKVVAIDGSRLDFRFRFTVYDEWLDEYGRNN